MLKTLKVLAPVSVLIACTAFAAPKAFNISPTSIRADSIHFGAVCQVDEPAVTCRMTLNDSTHNAVIGTFNVANNDTLDFATPCVNALETVVIGGEARGVNRSGDVSINKTTARGEGTCGDLPPNAPRSFIIFFSAAPQ